MYETTLSLLLAQSQNLSQEHLGIIHDTGNELRARFRRKDGHILERVDSDWFNNAHGAGLEDTMGGILGIGDKLGVVVVRVAIGNGGDTLSVHVDLEILAVGRESCSSCSSCCQGIKDVPFVGETITVSVYIRGQPDNS